MSTNFVYGLKSMGVPILGGEGLFTQGDSYFVDPLGGNDGNSGKDIDSAKKTLLAGYNLLTAGQNDVLYYVAGTNSVQLAAGLTWAKNYTHLVGIGAPTNIAQRARIFMTAGVADSPMLNITASGCSFRNFYIFHGVASASALVNVQVTGGRNYFGNVHMAGIGNDTQDAAGACSLKLDDAEENLFEGCSIGLDTIARGTAANSEILIDTNSRRNTFKDCFIYAWIESATNHPLVKLADATAIDRFLLFDNCMFYHFSQSYLITQAGIFSLPVLSQGHVIVKDCVGMSGTPTATKWDVNDRDKIYLFNSAIPAADTAGLTFNV